jgi:hypothetical protein
MLPIAQVYLRDVPMPCLPGPGNLLQVLWCPFDHDPAKPEPKTKVIWRPDTEIDDVPGKVPEPAAAKHPRYVPQPCVLHPEQITEYPNYLDLSKDLKDMVRRWCGEQATGTGPGSFYTVDPKVFYWDELSTAPGWKIGGWPRWGLTDPIPLQCSACGDIMVPLLTIDSLEWDTSTRSWIPFEDQERAAAPTVIGAPDPGRPTMLVIHDLNCLQLYACQTSPGHPHAELVQ